MKHTLQLLATILVLFISLISCGLFPTSSNKPDDPVIVHGDVDVSTFRTDWKIAFIPVQVTENYTQGKILWHRPIKQTPINEIYDDVGTGSIRPFRMIFRPDTNNTPSWAGITTRFETEIPEISKHFEFRAKGSGKIHIDFGMISEDMNGNSIFDTEDRDRSGYIEDGEDIGLDGLPDSLEPGYDPVSNPDPNGDNWFSFFDSFGKCPLPNGDCSSISEDDYYHPQYYDFLNGTEGNETDGSSARLPDEERFGSQFNTLNSYLTLEVDLDSSPYRIDSTEKNGWYTYRILLNSLTHIPSEQPAYFYYQKLRHIRIWFEADASQTKADTLEIAHWNFEPFVVNNSETDYNTYEYRRDYEYTERRIFDLTLPFDSLKSTDRVTKLIMFESVPAYNAQDIQQFANFYANPNDTSQYRSESLTGNNTLVKEIPLENYSFYNNVPNNIPFIVFNRSQARSINLGFYMEVTDTNSNVRTFGKLDNLLIKIIDSTAVIDSVTNDTLMSFVTDTSFVHYLKLLCRTDYLYNPTDITWQMMWRNCYDIPKGVDIEDLQIKVFKGIEGREKSIYSLDYQDEDIFTNKYLTILGLDLESNFSSSSNPDGIVDEKPLIYRPDWGLLIFPSRTPFDDTVAYSYGDIELPELDLKVPALYDYTSWIEKSEASQYFIRIK